MNDLFGKRRARRKNGPSSHALKMGELLRIFSAKGMTLAQCCDPKVMDRSAYTLKRYARRFRLRFADYVPMKLRRSR